MSERTYTFPQVWAQEKREIPCSSCGKPLSRTFKEWCSINPFNKNEAGEVCTREEVRAQAQASAKRAADAAVEKGVTCRTCQDAPVHALLLEMAADPSRIFPPPQPYFNSPLHVLADRGQAQEAYDRCDCGSQCCSGFRRLGGYRLTAKGIERASVLTRTAEHSS